MERVCYSPTTADTAAIPATRQRPVFRSTPAPHTADPREFFGYRYSQAMLGDLEGIDLEARPEARAREVYILDTTEPPAVEGAAPRPERPSPGKPPAPRPTTVPQAEPEPDGDFDPVIHPRVTRWTTATMRG